MKQLKWSVIAVFLLLGVESNCQTVKDEASLEERAVTLRMQSFIALQNGTPAREIEFDSDGNKTLEKTYKVKTGEQQTHLTFTYDGQNKLLDEVSYNADGAVIQTISHAVNRAGNTVIKTISGKKENADELEVKVRVFQNDTMLVETMTLRSTVHSNSETFTYHPNGETSSKSTYRGAKVSPATELRYDEKGQKVVSIRYNNEGKPHTRIEFIYNDKGDVTNRKAFEKGKTLTREQSTDVDQNGNVTASYDWKPGEEKRQIWAYTYDDKGNLLHSYGTDPLIANQLESGKEESFLYDSENRVTVTVINKKAVLNKTTYEYSADGSVTESYWRTPDRGLRPQEAIEKSDMFHIYRTQIKDVETKKVLKEEIFQKGELSSATIYTYDENWNMLSLISSSRQGRGREIIQEFDSKDRLISNQEYKVRDGEKALSKKSEYAFDERDNMTLSSVCRRIDKGDDALCTEIRKQFDEDGRLMVQKEIENDALMVHVKYTYNDEKQLVKFVTIYGEATYKYDKKGEMIEQRFETREGEASGINTWAITYH